MKINFIIIYILFSLISNIPIYFNPISTHLTKDKTIIIPAVNNGVIFNSDSFGEGDNIYFLNYSSQIQ